MRNRINKCPIGGILLHIWPCFLTNKILLKHKTNIIESFIWRGKKTEKKNLAQRLKYNQSVGQRVNEDYMHQTYSSNLLSLPSETPAG